MLSSVYLPLHVRGWSGDNAKLDGWHCHAMDVWRWKLSKATWDEVGATKRNRRWGSAETSRWLADMGQMSSLALYRTHKATILAENLYDNSRGSALYLRLVQGSTIRCRVWGEDEENIEHIVLQCDQLHPHQPDGTTLPEVLGLVERRDEHGEIVHPLASTSVTKARLSEWWSLGR
ncbi:hypothetical protein HPB50_026645 [Hyalomma asiaticum]|uniref:Uncharacterized protein n=1 Tax=Hyalomma asiaticum TaxID=266040 RepID=A0ACB7SZL8_HYAAI|nr:hypothetical protein HPB50_026645 [Hyalomma asiaticum]